MIGQEIRLVKRRKTARGLFPLLDFDIRFFSTAEKGWRMQNLDVHFEYLLGGPRLLMWELCRWSEVGFHSRRINDFRDCNFLLSREQARLDETTPRGKRSCDLTRFPKVEL